MPKPTKKTKSPTSDLLTIPQAAKALKITRQGVLLAITRGKLESVKIGHVSLIPKTTLQQYRKTRKPGRPKKQTK